MAIEKGRGGEVEVFKSEVFFFIKVLHEKFQAGSEEGVGWEIEVFIKGYQNLLPIGETSGEHLGVNWRFLITFFRTQPVLCITDILQLFTNQKSDFVHNFTNSTLGWKITFSMFFTLSLCS